MGSKTFSGILRRHMAPKGASSTLACAEASPQYSFFRHLESNFGLSLNCLLEYEDCLVVESEANVARQPCRGAAETKLS